MDATEKYLKDKDAQLKKYLEDKDEELHKILSSQYYGKKRGTPGKGINWSTGGVRGKKDWRKFDHSGQKLVQKLYSKGGKV